MTIEIDEPELQEILQQRLSTGSFRDLADVVGQALRSSPPVSSTQRATTGRSEFTGADLIAAMQACPHPDFEMEQPRYASPVRDIAF